MGRLRSVILAFSLVVSASLALTACSTNAATPMTSATIPTVAGTWDGHIDIQDTGAFSGLSGTVYLRVEQTTEGSLSGEAKLCDMSVFGDKGPEYYPLTGAADRSNHIKLDIKLDPVVYHLEGPFDAERLRLTGTLTEIYAGPNPKSAPATSVLTPASASEYAAACPRQSTSTIPA
jgi:hypothetical protein